MIGRRAYLDDNASSPLRPEARDAMFAALGQSGNPSSVHAEGQAARGLIERARDAIAREAGVRAEDIIFTSGATEALNTVLRPAFWGDVGTSSSTGPLTELVIGATEHVAALTGHGWPSDQVRVVPVTAGGVIDQQALSTALEACQAGGRRPIVAVQYANNETGVLQPIGEISDRVHDAGGVVVCDCVQGVGRLDPMFPAGPDAMIVSSHKTGGPTGVGAIVLRAETPVAPFVRGGGQERNRRGGTEAVAAIAGFGAAIDAVATQGQIERQRIAALRDSLEADLRSMSPDMVVFGAGSPRLPNTICFTVAGLRAETAVIALDLEGVAVSSGSACSSGKVATSHVLEAMGVAPEMAAGAIRVSLGWATSSEDVTHVLEAWRTIYSALRERRAAA